MYLQKFRKTLFVWAIHHEKLSTALLLFIAFACGGAIYFIILNVTAKHTDSRHLRYELMPVLFSFQMPSEHKPPSYWFTIETPQGQNAQIGTRSLVKAQQVTDTACVDIRKRTLDGHLRYRFAAMGNCT